MNKYPILNELARLRHEHQIAIMLLTNMERAVKESDKKDLYDVMHTYDEVINNMTGLPLSIKDISVPEGNRLRPAPKTVEPVMSSY